MGPHVHHDSLDRSRTLVGDMLRARDGKSTIGLILTILGVAAIVYMGFMIVPPYITNYKLEVKLRSVAELAHREKRDDVLRHEINKELEILELDIPSDAIVIQRDPHYGQWIDITVDYDQEVELKPFGQVITLSFSAYVHETV